jgi:hypothetical protein
VSAAEPVKQDNAAPPRRRLPAFAAFVLTICAVWLGGQFVTQGLSDYFLDDDPGLAVLWRGDSPDALTRFANFLLPLRRYGTAAQLAARALRISPLNATAIAAYGLALDGAGQADKADQVLTIAGQRSWRDAPTQIWLLKRRLIQGRYAEGIAHIDALLRQEDHYPPLPLAILSAVALEPRAVQPLADRLAFAPAWRTPFFQFMANAPRADIVNAEGVLLAHLTTTPAPPTDQELGFYVNRLLQDRNYQQAAAEWRRLSPPADISPALLNNGDFTRPARQTPFDWQIGSGIGWTAQVGDAPGQDHAKALNVAYDAVSTPQPVRQFLVLPPGAYRFSGMGYDQNGQGADVMAWKVACDGHADALGSVTMSPGPQGQWRPFSVDFTVPATDCEAQTLTLSASPGDVHKDVGVWFDSLAIAPIAAPVAPSAQSPGARPAGQ